MFSVFFASILEESNMLTDSEKRLESFEKMLLSIRQDYDAIGRKMQTLKDEGKEKTATYRQLMGNKLQYTAMLSLYKSFGLLE